MEDKPAQKPRKHMRSIRDDIGGGKLDDIPAQLRAMKMLWNPATQNGLLIRRDREAELVEDGIKCNCWR
jgi:GH24 family phage-related lysozyme (muramidase)